MKRENLSSGFPTRYDTKRSVQPQEMARGWKFRIEELEGLYYEPRREKTGFFAYAKTKSQISFAVTAKLISAFVFAIRIVQSLYYLPGFKFNFFDNLLKLASDTVFNLLNLMVDMHFLNHIQFYAVLQPFQ